MRVVPIFPELRPYLEEAHELNRDKSEYAIGTPTRTCELDC